MTIQRSLVIETTHGHLHGHLTRPEYARSMILIARGGDPHGPQAHLASSLLEHRHAVLELDFLTSQEMHYPDMAHNVHLLAPRFLKALEFLGRDGDSEGLPIGIFAAGGMAAAALRAAAQRDADVRALVLYQGMIDHAGREYLEVLQAPTLVLIANDDEVLSAATQRALLHIHSAHELRYADPQTLAAAATEWFERYV